MCSYGGKSSSQDARPTSFCILTDSHTGSFVKHKHSPLVQDLSRVWISGHNSFPYTGVLGHPPDIMGPPVENLVTVSVTLVPTV